MTMNYGGADIYAPSGLAPMGGQPYAQQQNVNPQRQGYYQPSAYYQRDNQSPAIQCPKWLKALGPMIGMIGGVVLGGWISHGILGNKSMSALTKGSLGALIITPLALAGSWFGLKTQQTIEESQRSQQQLYIRV